MVVFTTSPTGLGHIRVMHAIRDGLYPGVKFEIVGLQNVKAGKIHSIGSRIPLLTKITEFYQTNPIAEAIVTFFYLDYLKRQRTQTLASLATIALDNPQDKNWVVISTHYALAYSILSVKKDLLKKYGVNMKLCVVVTDDSPQRVWAVKDADLVFVPSEKTKERLMKLGLKEEQVRVISFPLSPRLGQRLTDEEFRKIVDQIDTDGNLPMHIEIPVSGAAVQLPYLEEIIRTLAPENFQFTVVGRSSEYTLKFFENISKLPHVQASIGTSTSQTVKLYESLFYQSIRPAVEITKPSEQTFKALLPPRSRGGVILLLTAPVGRQEYDNLNFLERHGIIPNAQEQAKLEKGEIDGEILARAVHWRALKLPKDPSKAAWFIKKMKEAGIFKLMLEYVPENKAELTGDGVKMIWEEINKFLIH